LFPLARYILSMLISDNMKCFEIPSGSETVEIFGHSLMVPVDARYLAIDGIRVGFYDTDGNLLLWTIVR
jgi:hypothetical protein